MSIFNTYTDHILFKFSFKISKLLPYHVARTFYNVLIFRSFISSSISHSYYTIFITHSWSFQTPFYHLFWSDICYTISITHLWSLWNLPSFLFTSFMRSDQLHYLYYLSIDLSTTFYHLFCDLFLISIYRGSLSLLLNFRHNKPTITSTPNQQLFSTASNRL